ncbi:P-loop containing nucleoside triphosphate hydrolase protein [Aspergillus venezuelensis]
MSSSHLGASGTACAVAVLLSVPHGSSLLTICRRDKSYTLIDSDSDDESVAMGKAPRSLWQRICLVLVAAVATAVACWSWMINQDTTITKVLEFVTWATILSQESAVSTNQDPRERYNLGCYSALSALTTGVAIVLPKALLLSRDERSVALSSIDALTVIQLVAAFILLIVNLSMPRGAAIYREGRIVDAQDSVSFLNRYTFAWAYKTLSVSIKKGRLEPDDLPLVAQEVRAQTLSNNFFDKGSTSVQWKRWFELYWKNAAAQITIQLCSGGVRFLPNFLLLSLLRLFEDRDEGASNQLQLWLTALCLGLSMITSSWLISLRNFIADLKISLPVNEQLFAVITKKAMSLKDIVLPARSSGVNDENDEDENDDDDEKDEASRTKHSILNLLGVDVGKISDFIAYSHLLLDSVVELILTIIFLLYLMGWKATVAGCAIPFLLSPVYYKITQAYSQKEQALMERRDEKSASLTEMVRGMRQIKFSALESEWYQKIQKLRGQELKEQQAVFWMNIALTAIWTFGPICMSFLSIVAYTYLTGSISPSTAFTALSLFENLQNILSILPEIVTDLLDARVSLRRIARFLGLEDHDDERELGDAIIFANATVTWPSRNSDDPLAQFQLKDLNLHFPTGELSIISGRSGSGKSLLLQALIGEVDIVKGSVTFPHAASSPEPPCGPDDWIVEGAVAYVSQDPWIENATIRDSILFGLPMNRTRYDDVLEACALLPDMKIFPEGDKTDIGANGVNLSGGQKWRLALARALYSRASILVLDDVFSAVDAHVGRHLYENALMGSLARGRTRILATHHVKLCQDGAAYFVKLDKGIVAQSHQSDSSEGAFSETADSSETSDIDSRPTPPKPSVDQNRRASVSSTKKFYEDEKRETGVVKTKVYKAYISASGGSLAWVMIGVLLVVLLILNLAIPYWVSIWTRSYEESNNTLNTQSPNTGPLAEAAPRAHLDKRLVYYGSIYLAISVASWILENIRLAIILHGSIRASKQMFEQFTATTLRAPLRFLDTTPVGQILNRFTSDFGTLDSDLALDFSSMMHALISVLGVIVAALVASPLIVGIGIVALAASWVVGYIYVTGAREAKRLESTAKSPIFELVGSLLTGLPTIRAFGRSEAYLKRMYGLIDIHCQTLWHRRLFACWQEFWLSLVGAIFVASVTMIFVSIRTLDAPLAGFALSFALDMSSNISWMLSQYADLEINLNAAERIIEYTNIDQEPVSGDPVPATWPLQGRIEVKDLSVSYAADLPPVLKNLNFSIKGGERVGVVGRTGAGKSSFAMTLLRCLDIRSGTIHIDGIDISQVSLHDLRSRVGIISQDPIVFAGSIREVLDPFNQHGDAELRNALEKVGLTSPNQNDEQDPTSTTDPNTDPSPSNIIPLSFTIAESGKNLSQGQRQLLCLARALVSRPKILIMDEATASIDMESDQRIQRVLREEIRGYGCTLIVIAHRLSTIADFERILVLDKGQVREFDTPGKLMRMEGGLFRSMVEGSGERGVVEGMVFGHSEDA